MANRKLAKAIKKHNKHVAISKRKQLQLPHVEETTDDYYDELAYYHACANSASQERDSHSYNHHRH